jgi:hypothetical protein
MLGITLCSFFCHNRAFILSFIPSVYFTKLVSTFLYHSHIAHLTLLVAKNIELNVQGLLLDFYLQHVYISFTIPYLYNLSGISRFY